MKSSRIQLTTLNKRLKLRKKSIRSLLIILKIIIEFFSF